MAGGYAIKELTASQRQTYRAVVEIYQAYLAALGQSRVFHGGMHWKKIRGRDYLYRYRDRYGHGESLGPRTEQTERLFGLFIEERGEVTARVRQERLLLQEQAAFCRAAKVNRVPRAAARILRRLEEEETGEDLLVIGSGALYAYEAAAGVFLDHARPVDLLAGPARTLTLLGAGKTAWEALLRLLRRTDRSFAPLPGGECRAGNKDGFQVRLLKSGSRRAGMQKTITVPGAREPLPPEAGHLHYLAAAAKFSQVVIGKDGGPATMAVADPRAFVLGKLWLSRQEDREESKRTRDLSQALAVADLVLRYLPQWDYFSTESDMLPQDLVQSAARFADGADTTGEETG